jgi:hypothetical protein
MQDFARRNPWLIAAIVAVLAAVGITVAVSDDDGDGKPDKVVITVQNAAGDPVKVEAPAPLVDEAEGTLEDSLRTPPAVAPDAQVEAARKAADENRRKLDPLPTAGASQGFKGCYTRFVSNQSSRGGVRPVWQVLHYTVSRNVAGWADVNAIVALFDRSSAQASSNFVIDAEGHCAYIVPIEAKAWTQAAANPFSISYEIVAYGDESTFMDSAGYRKLASVMRQVSARTGIPLRAGSTNGCSPGSSGIVQHFDFGICGGGHHDITPFSKAQVIRIVQRDTVPKVQRKPLTARWLPCWRTCACGCGPRARCSSPIWSR